MSLNAIDIYHILSVFFLMTLSTIVYGSEATTSFLYDRGLEQSTQIAKGIWTSYNGDCKYVDAFLDAIGVESAKAVKKIRRGEYSEDLDGFGSGFLQGLRKTINDVVMDCAMACREAGKISGRVSAEFYCAVSIASNRPATFARLVSQPNIICGSTYSMECEASFFAAVVNDRKGCEVYVNDVPELAKYYRAGTGLHGGACTYSK